MHMVALVPVIAYKNSSENGTIYANTYPASINGVARTLKTLRTSKRDYKIKQ